MADKKEYAPRPVEERLTRLEYDMKFAHCRSIDEVDFKVFYDPKNTDETHKNGMASEGSLSYLFKLENYLDWGAFKDEQGDDAQKKKNARYRHEDAARARRIAYIKLSKPKDAAPADDEVPW